MKIKLLLLLSFVFTNSILIAQCPTPPVIGVISGNSIQATISNGGDLFFDGQNGRFHAPSNILPLRSTIFAAGLWLGGFDPEQNLKLSAQGYGRYSNQFDFIPGPLKPDTGDQFENHCENFNKIWIVEKEDILNHLSDFEDNGIIDNPIPSIYSWPGNNNEHSYFYNGFFLPYSPQQWAPFVDNNNDGNYEPHNGDYPHPENVIQGLIPEQISWSVFNDNTIRDPFFSETDGVPLKVEIQLTSWNFSCLGNHVLEHTLFTSHKIINRSQQNIDSMYVGLFVDFDNGCHLDDFIGCSPENDGFLVYNSDALDGESSPVDCAGVETYGNNPPAQSVAFLNQKLDKFIYFNNSAIGTPPPNANYYAPETPQEFYNYLSGSWTDGQPLTYGGSGFGQPNGIPTNFAFPGNPNDESGWSLYTEGLADGDRRSIGSSYAGSLEPGSVFKIDMAHTFHGYSGLNNLESVDQAYLELAQMQQMYDMKFNSWCNDIIAETKEIINNAIDVFPNPSDGKIFIKSEKQLNSVEIYDQLGRLVLIKDFGHQLFGEIDFDGQSNRIYILKIKSEDKIIAKKILIQ